MKFIKTGIDIAIKWENRLKLTSIEKGRSAEIMETVLNSATLSLWQKYYTF